MGSTGIPYLTDVWNPVTGCTPLDAGCTDCWAQRCLSMGRSGGKLAPVLHEARLNEPEHWRKRRERVGVCFMGDLFHRDLSFEQIKRVLDVIRMNPEHGWFLLTKRANRMALHHQQDTQGIPWYVWCGATAHDQDTYDMRSQSLATIVPNHTWMSLEPLLGHIDLGMVPPDWIVVGCHNGRLADKCELDSVSQIVRQCKATGTPVYVKQLYINGRVSTNTAEWPEELRVRELPEKDRG